ncbi:hypothetical protein [Pseudosulfitobacter pseudonitzschiae]|uniref:hypothetical protein n=1 Tax=Pseudosulfitobacter pseudonitzschiae TaxID=1402135 RepID=UPI003B799D6F
MRRFRFNPLLHVPVAVIGAIIAVTIIARPELDMVIPQATLQSKIDERLPVARQFAAGIAEIRTARVQFKNDNILRLEVLADIDAAGAPDAIDADFEIQFRYSEGDVYIEDITVGRVDFNMQDVEPGSFQYTLLQGVFVAGASTLEQDLSTKPVVELRNGPFEQRFMGNLVERATFLDEELHITVSPGQLFRGFLFEIVLTLGILALTAGFIGRKHRKTLPDHPTET